MSEIPPPPTDDSASKKQGLLNRATQAAKASVEKTQQAKAEREAHKTLQAEEHAAASPHNASATLMRVNLSWSTKLNSFERRSSVTRSTPANSNSPSISGLGRGGT